MGDEQRTREEGWQQVAGDRSPASVGAEDQGAPETEPTTPDDAEQMDRDRRTGDVTPAADGLTPSGEDEDTPERPA